MCDLVIDDTVKKLDRRGVIGETFDMIDAELKKREELADLNFDCESCKL